MTTKGRTRLSPPAAAALASRLAGRPVSVDVVRRLLRTKRLHGRRGVSGQWSVSEADVLRHWGQEGAA